MKKLITYFTAGLILCTLSGCRKKEQESAPDKVKILWGFTTRNFQSALPVSETNTLKLIDFAKEQGYSWIELRDPDASLNKEVCGRIAAYARKSEIEVVYSVQRGILAPDFKQVLQKGFENARLFKGPRMLRVLALRDQHPIGWSELDFKDAITLANQASSLAASADFRLMIENADVVLDGEKYGCFGLSKLLDVISPNIELQLDTANFFTGPSEVSAEEVESFIRKYASRISYVHIKSAKDMKEQPVLNGNPLNFKSILDILTGQTQPVYVAIELASQSDDPEVIYGNMKESLNWLKETGLFKTE